MVHVSSEPEHPVTALRYCRALVFSWCGGEQLCSRWEWLCWPGMMSVRRATQLIKIVPHRGHAA